MSLPSLARLQLATDAPNAEPPRRKRPNGALPGPASRREPPFIDGVPRRLQNIERVETLAKQDNYVFSAITGNGGIYAMKYLTTVTILPFKDSKETVTELVKMIQDEFGNHTRDPPQRNKKCGTFNCVFKRALRDDNDVDMAIRALYVAMFPAERGGVSPFLPMVAVRAPQQNNEGFSDERTAAAADELKLTLRLAERGLTPAVLLAVPVPVHDRYGTDSFSGFIYITEAGWVDLKEFIYTTQPRVLTELSNELVQAFRSLSNENVLLFDGKPLNMVARDRNGYTEVRFIDFGSDFSVSATKPDTDVTSSDCVFVINSLHFINTSIDFARNALGRSKGLLGSLALEVVATWRASKRTGRLSAFCNLLDQDRGFAGGAIVYRENGERRIEGMNVYENLNDASGQMFLSRLREAFYVMLMHYEFEPLVWAERQSTEFYMEAITGRLITLFGIQEADIEAAVMLRAGRP